MSHLKTQKEGNREWRVLFVGCAVQWHAGGGEMRCVEEAVGGVKSADHDFAHTQTVKRE